MGARIKAIAMQSSTIDFHYLVIGIWNKLADIACVAVLPLGGLLSLAWAYFLLSRAGYLLGIW